MIINKSLLNKMGKWFRQDELRDSIISEGFVWMLGELVAIRPLANFHAMSPC